MRPPPRLTDAPPTLVGSIGHCGTDPVNVLVIPEASAAYSNCNTGTVSMGTTTSLLGSRAGAGFGKIVELPLGAVSVSMPFPRLASMGRVPP